MTDVQVKPNFFIIGAAKAGTNTIHKVLSRSDKVFFSDPKEPNYFVARDDEKRDWYYDLFKDAAGYAVRGEKTVSYSGFQTAEHAARRIAEECPDSKIVFSVRQPHDRAISHWRMLRRAKPETPDFEEALEQANMWRNAVQRSRYMEIANHYIARFGAERVKIVLLDDLECNQEACFIEICDFLGIPLPELNYDRKIVRNVADSAPVFVERPVMSDAMHTRISEALCDDVLALFKHLDRDPAIWGF